MATLYPEPTSSEYLQADEPNPPLTNSYFSHTPSTMTQRSFGSSRSAFTIALPCAPKRGAVLALAFLLCFHLALGNVGKMCKDLNLEQATAMASVVVSGTVKKVMYDHDNSLNETRMFAGQIEIKRVFKGEDEVDRVAKDVRGTFRVYKNVVVEGFGDPKICQNLVKERETKIFMLNLSDDGQLKLNSSIIPLTLNFLDYVDAVVH
ncbi:agrin-like, partial [Physella acuta]|uniref:agrin-like n=1 Tax=Physella acuta TaxID=109671 RepID=UPI0027DE2AB5